MSGDRRGCHEIRRVFSETYPKYFNLGPDAAKLDFAPA